MIDLIIMQHERNIPEDSVAASAFVAASVEPALPGALLAKVNSNEHSRSTVGSMVHFANVGVEKVSVRHESSVSGGAGRGSTVGRTRSLPW